MQTEHIEEMRLTCQLEEGAYYLDDSHRTVVLLGGLEPVSGPISLQSLYEK